MTFEISLAQLFTVCAVINGLVFTLLILEKKENKQANRFLALAIICLCLTFTPYMLDTSVWHQYRWLAWMPFSFSYWIGPAFYFYLRILTHGQKEVRGKDLWHFSPIVLNYIHSIYHGLVGPSNPLPYFHHLAEILESASIFSVLIYMLIGFRLIRRYQSDLLDHVSNLDHIDLSWITNFIKVTCLSFAVVLIYLLVSSGFVGKEELYRWDTLRSIMLVVYCVFLYWLSINGYRQIQIISLPEIPESPEKDKTSGLIQKLEVVLREQHLYRNPQLNLTELASSMEISEKALSQVINQELNRNFYQLINEYRIEEVKERLLDPDHSHLKILSLALDAGFNSKASFNRVFKSQTGLTPQQYRSQNFRQATSFETSLR